MRILVDNGSYHLRNTGDVAMLQTAVTRLKRLWPHAVIEVITTSPYLLSLYCPAAQPIHPRGRNGWSRGHRVLLRLLFLIPKPALQMLFELREILLGRPQAQAAIRLMGVVRRRFRRKVRPAIRRMGLVRQQLGRKPHPDDARIEANSGPPAHRWNMVARADLVVADGGGYVTDVFKEQGTRVLDTLEMAIRLGKPTAMLGQGMGPIREPDLWMKAQKVIPWVDLIAMREKRAGEPILEALGVARQKVITTGDDAVELAHEARSRRLGTGLGINLRAAYYSAVPDEQIIRLREVLHRVASRLDAPLVALPIAHGALESDDDTIKRLLLGYRDRISVWRKYDQPLKLLQRVRRCRVVVSGSYHGAVFALAQGIPVVGLVKSEYYRDKFTGLSDVFGTGCEVVLLDGDDVSDRLEQSIQLAWESAEQVRPLLLHAAVRQIEMANAAYHRLFDLVEAGRVKGSNNGRQP